MMFTWLPVSNKTVIGLELMYAVVVGSGSHCKGVICVFIICSAPEYMLDVTGAQGEHPASENSGSGLLGLLGTWDMCVGDVNSLY